MDQRSKFQQGHVETKFDMDDPKGILSMLKYFWDHSRSLTGLYEVTSGFIDYAPMELKLDMNDPYDNQNIYQIC